MMVAMTPTFDGLLSSVGTTEIVLVLLALGGFGIGGFVLLQAAIAWVKSVVVRLIYRHAITTLILSSGIGIDTFMNDSNGLNAAISLLQGALGGLM